MQRVTYIISLVSTMLFFVLYPFWFSWYLFVVLLLLAPFDLIISLPGMLSRKIAFSSPRVLELGERAVVTLTTVRKRWEFPARCIKIWLQTVTDDASAFRRHICSAAYGSRYEVAIDTSRSGIVSYTLGRMWTVSLLGFFSLPGPVRIKTSVLVLPQPMKPPLTVALPRGVIFRPKPGGGFAEDHDLRSYRPGDPVRSIHWKISAKTDSLIIREPLVPPPHSRLIIITKWKNPKERSIILGHLRWLSDYLLKWELPFYVKFGEKGIVTEITQPGDLIEYLYYELCDSSAVRKLPVSEPVRFTWVFRIDAGASGSKKTAPSAAGREVGM